MEHKKLRDVIYDLRGTSFDLIYNKEILPTDYLGFPFEKDMDREVLGIKPLIKNTEIGGFLDYALFLGEVIWNYY